mgnify:CR=1 FL=1
MNKIIEIKHLSKSYGTIKAVDQVSFSVNEGELFAFLGPNGAGKSTTMKILTGFLPPSSGEAWINGLEINENSLEIRKHIG